MRMRAVATTPVLRRFSGRLFSTDRYTWVDVEARDLISRAYQLHKPSSPPPSLQFDRARLESLSTVLPQYPVVGVRDHVARFIVSGLERLMHLFFREKYDHHAVCLETVAAVPGMVAAMHRHMRSLRKMERDHGWIGVLLEEAQNERMHLLIWLKHTQPTRLERFFVLAAQYAYAAAYATLYIVSPTTAHRSVGFLEECAHRAYNDYLRAIDAGQIANVPAGEIARQYYHLPDNATLRDVVLHVRGDEAYHALYNHHFADMLKSGRGMDDPVAPEHGLDFANKRD